MIVVTQAACVPRATRLAAMVCMQGSRLFGQWLAADFSEVGRTAAAAAEAAHAVRAMSTTGAATRGAEGLLSGAEQPFIQVCLGVVPWL